MFRIAALSLLLGCCDIASCQFKTVLLNDEGASAPCVGVGPIAEPAVKKCIDLFEHAGFLKEADAGVSGMVVGNTAKDDAVITAVDVGSAAAQAGLSVGDVVIAVDGKSVKPTPEAIVTQNIFGPKGEALHLKIRRGEATIDVTLVRAPQPPPPNVPTASGFMISVKPVIDWRGQFAPCIGAGPVGPAAISYCDGHFKPFGYIKVGDRGGTGIELVKDEAKIAAVAPNSPAAKADLKPGDEIVAIEGKPITGSAGDVANRSLFGKAGDQKHIAIHRNDADKEVVLTLAARPK